MRLNRVLLLAATFITMIFAMVFTISCSGDDGKNGKDGRSCMAKKNSDGNYDIYCGDDDTVQGTLYQGAPGKDGTAVAKGDKGDKGDKGEKGDPGVIDGLPVGSCLVKEIGTAWHAWCEDEDAGVIAGTGSGTNGGCAAETGGASDPYLVVLKCGADTEIYLCGGEVFDPATSYCSSIRVEKSPTTTFGASNYVVMPVVKESLCNGEAYDMRKNFCDDSPITEIIKPLCGTQKEKYRTGPSPYGGEECKGGKVVKKCGVGTSAVEYVKATQFCMNATTSTVKDRCGTANSKTGVYGTGKSSISGDMTYSQGYSATIAGTSYLKGEYDTSLQERCEGGKVVKICGEQFYEEKDSFCAVGDVIAPHCTDRKIYNPTTKYCSFMGNGSTNISEVPGDGFFNYDEDASVCTAGNSDYDPSSSKCLKYASTAIDFCGTVPATGAGVLNKPNSGSWKWEFCIRSDATTTIIRCAELQRPTNTTTPVCECIPNSSLIGVGYNGCKCDNGYKFNFDNNLATGLLTRNLAETTEALMYPYVTTRGGQCVLTCSSLEQAKPDNTCCDAGKLYVVNTCQTAPAVCTWTSQVLTSITGGACVAIGTETGKCLAANVIETDNGVKYCNAALNP